MASLKPLGALSHFFPPPKGGVGKMGNPTVPTAGEMGKMGKGKKDLRRDDVARLGEGGEGIARTWLVTFINCEVLRRYQEPVALDRVLSEHHAALAAVPVYG